MGIKERIKEVRTKLNFSQSGFAKRVFIRQTLLGDIELGNRKVTDKTIRLISTEFNVNKEWILSRPGDMPPPHDIQLETLIDIFKQLHKPLRDYLLEQSKGLLTSILDAANAIDFGRKGFAIRGEEQKGRILYKDGIAKAMTSFLEAKASADPETIIRTENAFIIQELQFCGEADWDSRNSLTKAMEGFQDAFLYLNVVENAVWYREAVDKTYPRNPKYCVQGFPKDAFYIACATHRTRIKNILRAPGIDAIEKRLLEQRFANLSAAKNNCNKKQGSALAG